MRDKSFEQISVFDRGLSNLCDTVCHLWRNEFAKGDNVRGGKEEAAT